MKNLMKVFIVEDDPIYASILQSNLKSQKDLFIKVFATGEQMVENLYLNPDVVLLDYNLEEMNGIDVLKEIKSFNPNVSVIFISSQEKTEVAVNTLKYGAIDYIVKNDRSITNLMQVLHKIKKLYYEVHMHKRKVFMKRVSIATAAAAIVASAMFIGL